MLEMMKSIMAGKIYIGTSGWSYKHWKIVFYPDHVKAKDHLDFYTNHFNVTEINSSFYRLPTVETVNKWVQTAPKKFKFCPKMSRFLSHAKKLKDPEEPLQRFFSVFDTIQKSLGPVLIQLHETLRFNYERTEYFYKLLQTQYKMYSFAMEARHQSWLQDDSLKLMRKYNIAFVIAQSGEKFAYGEHVTAKHIYVRFHGPEGLYTSSYTEEMLQSFAVKFKAWKKEGHTIWAFFNNDVGGYAIMNAKRLLELTC